MVELVQGQNTDLAGNSFKARVLWTGGSPSSPVDASAFMLQSSGKVSGDEDMVFYGQKSSSDGSVSIVAEQAETGNSGGEVEFSINISKVAGSVERIAFTATTPAESSPPLNTVDSLSIKLTPESGDAIAFNINTASCTEAAMILGEFYRRNGQWKYRAVGQGFEGGLAPLATHFGVMVDGDEKSTPPPTEPKTADENPQPSLKSAQENRHSDTTKVDTASSTVSQNPTLMPPASPIQQQTQTQTPPSNSTTRDNSMLDWLKKNTETARAALTAEIGKYKNKGFMEAVVSACALVAAADGNVSSEEKQKMMGYMQSSDELKVFKTLDVMNAFNDAVAKFEFDAEIGKAEALKTISKLKSDEGASKLLVRVCCAIGAADGEFDAQEKAMVALIATDLGLNAAEFDLA